MSKLSNFSTLYWNVLTIESGCYNLKELSLVKTKSLVWIMYSSPCIYMARVNCCVTRVFPAAIQLRIGWLIWTASMTTFIFVYVNVLNMLESDFDKIKSNTWNLNCVLNNGIKSVFMPPPAFYVCDCLFECIVSMQLIDSNWLN